MPTNYWQINTGSVTCTKIMEYYILDQCCDYHCSVSVAFMATTLMHDAAEFWTNEGSPSSFAVLIQLGPSMLYCCILFESAGYVLRE